MIFERFGTGLVFVLWLNTILGFQYQASTLPRLQTFKTRLENESQIGTPICQNLIIITIFCLQDNHIYSQGSHKAPTKQSADEPSQTFCFLIDLSFGCLIWTSLECTVPFDIQNSIQKFLFGSSTWVPCKF